MKIAFRGLYGGSFREPGYVSMSYVKALRIAERTLIDGATLAELRQASKDLRAMNPDSVLANLVDSKIASLERRQGASRFVLSES